MLNEAVFMQVGGARFTGEEATKKLEAIRSTQSSDLSPLQNVNLDDCRIFCTYMGVAGSYYDPAADVWNIVFEPADYRVDLVPVSRDGLRRKVISQNFDVFCGNLHFSIEVFKPIEIDRQNNGKISPLEALSLLKQAVSRGAK